MEQFRRKYCNDINDEILHLEKSQERDKESINVLKSMKIDQNIFDNKLELINAKMAERDNKIKALRRKHSDVITGDYDSEFKPQIQKKHVSRVQNIVKPVIKVKTKRRSRRKSYNSEDLTEKQFSYEYKKFRRNADMLPDYKKKKLEKMPQNKGYIWRDVWHYGKLPRQYGQAQIMFEDLRGGILRIHEIHSNEIKIYEKQGKNSKRVLISHTVRNRIPTGFPEIDNEFY